MSFGVSGAIRWSVEYRRPWKLFTLVLGIALLLAGSVYMPAPDWDVGVSFIMAILTYLSAPWLLHVLWRRQWRLWPLALLAAWFSIDGAYWMYWSLVDPEALIMRSANAYASTFLYLLMGMVWLYPGSLRQLWGETRGAVREALRPGDGKG
ncbi:MAG: hypothetical protein PHI49_00045 [Halothiobacillaceae bacterium]|jgi:hypothetical protein|nr:hypothetical protein [Halothiobacillaceae bacterium]MDY0050311.1 hypothetical protein [Halothiobacillaceae bacterium]